MLKKTVLGLAVAVAGVLALANFAGRTSAQPASRDAAAPGPALLGDTGLHAGDAVVVYLRGDALGLAVANRIPDVGNLPRYSGTLANVSGDWIVLQGEKQRIHVPKAAIALIESTAGPKPEK